ncbi:MAG: PepSY domain-containing protein [Gammaproteobacteria bacterium]|nr:PepSY domain-containing protein [Gammaproteobacteria bacterium]
MSRTLLIGLVGICAAALLAVGSIAAPHEDGWHEEKSAYEMAREAVARGEALPLHDVRRRLQSVAPGKIVATHYEFEFERWVYEFKIVDRAGRLQKIHLDAKTGELVMQSDY